MTRYFCEKLHSWAKGIYFSLLTILIVKSASQKWAVLLLGLSLIGVVVYTLKDNDPSTLQGALRQSQDLKRMLCWTWQWHKTVDAYRGGTTISAYSEKDQVLTFWEDGTFERRSNSQVQQGIWDLDEANRSLALVDGARANHRVIRASDFRHQLRKLTSDTLILAWQGRHGEVAELYEALSLPPRDNEEATQ